VTGGGRVAIVVDRVGDCRSWGGNVVLRVARGQIASVGVFDR